MNKEIVIDFANNGTVESMHFDEFPLGFLGKATVERASEIFFNEDTQLWDILLPGQEAPCVNAAGFAGYDVARRFEVEWLQECRKARVPPTTEFGMVLCHELRNDTGRYT